MPTARVNDTDIYYEEKGEGEPLLAIMGLAADSTAWLLQVPEWSKHFRTITFDNRDVGRSAYVDGEYAITDMAADAIALADELGLETFHLVGVSMGGMIAQELALAAPARVRTLTLAMTWGGHGHWGRVRGRLMANAALRTPQEEHVEQLMHSSLSEELFEDPERVAYFRKLAIENPHPQSVEAFARQAQAIGRHEARERLGRLAVPVHVIGAEHDMMVPVWKSRELAELVPHARLTVLAGGSHAANLEKADEFNRAVLAFLGEHARDAPGAAYPSAPSSRASASERTTAS